MATWNPLTDTETGHKKPVVMGLFRRLRDMVLAMGQGAPGAQRIFHAAFGAHAAGNVVIEQISPWWATIVLETASIGGTGTFGSFNNFVGDLRTHQVLTAGTIRIKGSVTSTKTGSGVITSANIRIIKNNTVVAMVGGNFSVDVTVAQDDVITFGGEVSGTAGVSGGSGTAFIDNLQICASERRFWRA